MPEDGSHRNAAANRGADRPAPYRGIPVYIDNRRIPAFHPVEQKDGSAWCPANEEANLLVATHHALQDTGRLLQMTSGLAEGDVKLLTKHIAVELHSLIHVLGRLADKAVISSKSAASKGDEITLSMKAKYDAERKAVESEVYTVRNSVGAHRGDTDWRRIVALYDSLDPGRFLPVYGAACTLFDHLKDLPLYAWLRHENGRMSLLDTRLGPFVPVARQ